MVEVHGAQHYKHIPFFHRTKADYLLSLKRDKDKIEWCVLNNFPIVILPDDREELWQSLVSLAISQD